MHKSQSDGERLALGELGMFLFSNACSYYYKETYISIHQIDDTANPAGDARGMMTKNTGTRTMILHTECLP